MTDQNTFNLQDYTQGQPIDLATNQVIQDNTQIDPSTYLQGDTAVLQASAGLGNISSENTDYFNQNNAFQTYDTNAVYGENIQTTNEIPTTTYGQTFEGTTTTNVIEGNNYFSDPNTIISNTTTTNEIQGNNIDINSYFNNETTNIDPNTNVIYGQTQIIPTTGTTTTTTTTTTTNYNTVYNQTQDIQGTTTYGETQIIPGTETNNYFTTTQTGETYQNNQIDYGQPTTTNDFISYQTTGTTDLNNYNFDTTQNLYTTGEPITQTNITTTTTTNTVTEPQYQTQVQNTFESNAIPMTETQYIPSQPQYDISQFQTDVNTLPTTTSTIINQPETQINQIQTQTQVVPSPVVQATYTPLPQQQIQTTQTTTTYTTQAQEPSQNLKAQNVVNTNNIINQAQPQPQPEPRIIQLPNKLNNNPLGFPPLKRIIDEDFIRGRPIYSDIIRPSNKLRYMEGQQNLITYRPRNVANHENIGLSRLTPSFSYDRAGLNPTLVSNNINSQVIPINNNVNNIQLDKMARSTSYNVSNQAINPLLNNVGLNQNNALDQNNNLFNLKNFV